MRTFEILQRMCDEEMDIRLAPLSNIIAVNIYGSKGQVTIGVSRAVAEELMTDKEFIGGFLLADKGQFDSLAGEE